MRIGLVATVLFLTLPRVVEAQLKFTTNNGAICKRRLKSAPVPAVGSTPDLFGEAISTLNGSRVLLT